MGERFWRRSMIALAMAAGLAASASAQFDADDPLAELDAIDEEALAAEAEATPGVAVTLRAIDRLRGEVLTIEAEVGAATEVWRLEVFVRACYRRTAERAPESSAFLQILDTKYVTPVESLASQAFPVSPFLTAVTRSARPRYVDPLVFSGWMFASSPALSAMEHARYDVWLVSCNTL